ncbi:MAG: PAS domain S-box protein, partial [Nitrospinota bacterium]|nr:PAS domain S-box protein [Nitrospinota bacterium]
AQMKEGVAVIQDNKIVLANEAMASMLGYDLDEITGIDIKQITGPSVFEGIVKLNKERLAGKDVPDCYETTIRKKDGAEVEVSVSTGVINFGGDPALLSSIRDITESRRAEAELRTQAAIMEHIAEGVQMIRMSDSVIVHANPKFERMFGYDHGELVGKHVSIQNMPTDQTPLDISSHIISILKNEGEWRGEIFNVRKDGTPFWTHTTVTRYQDTEHGDVMLVVKRDVTETKLAREALKESEERFRMFFDNSPDAMLLAEADTGTLLEANQAAEKLFKRPRKEFSGMHQSRLHPPTDEMMAREKFRNRVNDPDPTIPVESQILRADETTAPVEVTGQRYMVNGQKVLLGVFRDLTERKKAEEALRDSEERYRALVESSDDCICLMDLRGKFHFMNQRGMELNGYKSLEEVTGKNCMDLLSGEFRPVMEGALKRVGRGEVCHVRYMTWWKGEKEMWWESILNPIRGHEGEVTAVLRISRDVTEQIKAEEELCRNQEILEAISQAQSRFILGEKAEIMFEGLLKRITALSRSEFGFIGEVHYDEAGKPYLKIHSISIMSGDKKAKKYMKKWFRRGMDLSELNSLYGAALTTGEYVISNDPAADPRSAGLPHGHPALNCFFGAPLKRGETLVGMIGLANRPGGYEESMKDFLEPFIATCASMIEANRADSRRLAAEKAVRDSEALFERLFSTTHMKLALLDRDMRFVKVNKAYAEADGKEESSFPGKNHFELYPNEENERIFRKVASTGETYTCYAKPFIYENNPERGITYWDVSVQPLREGAGNVSGLLLSLLNVTERKQAEEQARVRQQQLIHADKMKSLGILVAGVAHEINNPNSFIAVNAPLLKRIWEQGTPLMKKSLEYNNGAMLGGMPMSRALEAAPKLLDGISEGSKRIQIIVEKLKNFARVEPGSKRRPVDMNSVVESSALLLASLIKKHTSNFVLRLGAGAPPVMGSQIEMEQVLINLISNALQSLDDKDREVTVETGFDQQRGVVLVTVRDQGCGIAEVDLGRITDPFYTTRREMGGTGLGLSVSFGIVRDHGGIMRFDSKPGVGTSVTLEFPVSNGGMP